MASKCCDNVSLLVCIIIILFGMGSWIAINGIWVELPLLVDQLPEGWNLPSYMAVVIQIANIGPITYTLTKLCCPNRNFQRPVVYAMVIIGSAASLLLAFFWTRTSVVGGVEHSTALLVLMFFLSLVDCTSSVVFLPFMNVFKPEYMTSYYVGEGFSGLIPSLVALGQGVGAVECVNQSLTNTTTNITEFSTVAVYLEPNFPVKDFFLFVFSMMVTCGIAFVLLNYLPFCKSEYTDRTFNSSHSYDLCDELKMSSTQKFVSETHEDEEPEQSVEHHATVIKLSKCSYLYLLIVIAWTNALTNGVLPSIQTYACLPYGSESYHLAVTLSQIANPASCCLAFFLPVTSGTVLSAVTLTGSAVSAYILALAVYSPIPPLVDSAAGPVLAVASFVVVFFLFTFAKVSIATIFRHAGGRGLLWCGAVTQLGSALGAAAMFVVVNVYQAFVQKYPCT
ncbi:solute carrier family 52, riboflavin transporter, member 3-B-like [Mya arenaria]|uniref:solute carrier family 52, riboflavin transporter, member 3-B-like n=1 Tax=Mya arenaria TaxID=6604 RepID=UPI0022E948AA|nr:solute carrier family 52, riboflavin transporter, member 3-B-like [Mya arenaria]XP_052816789.1 solute carrier family 52, riboflavin transporter, member 3-B-like [Mya arenaria]